MAPQNIKPLKLADINHPNSTNIVNTWADNVKQTVEQQATQIKTLQTQINGMSGSSSSSTSKPASSTASTTDESVTVTDVTSSRAFGTAYLNGSATTILVHGYATTPGSVWCKLEAFADATTTPTQQIWGDQVGATTSGAPIGFCFPVPPGWYYKINAGGSGTPTLVKWFETTL